MIAKLHALLSSLLLSIEFAGERREPDAQRAACEREVSHERSFENAIARAQANVRKHGSDTFWLPTDHAVALRPNTRAALPDSAETTLILGCFRLFCRLPNGACAPTLPVASSHAGGASEHAFHARARLATQEKFAMSAQVSITRAGRKCPHCGSTTVASSRMSGFLKRFSGVFGLKRYRCLDCWNRFWRTSW